METFRGGSWWWWVILCCAGVLAKGSASRRAGDVKQISRMGLTVMMTSEQLQPTTRQRKKPEAWGVYCCFNEGQMTCNLPLLGVQQMQSTSGEWPPAAMYNVCHQKRSANVGVGAGCWWSRDSSMVVLVRVAAAAAAAGSTLHIPFSISSLIQLQNMMKVLLL